MYAASFASIDFLQFVFRSMLAPVV